MINFVIFHFLVLLGGGMCGEMCVRRDRKGVCVCVCVCACVVQCGRMCVGGPKELWGGDRGCVCKRCPTLC